MRTLMRPGGLIAALLMAGTLAWPAPAPAGERPTPEERARVEQALRAMGFVSWEEIEREDDGRVFEVDDARMPDGTKYDLKLAADDLRVIERKRD
jgi:uncharacterized membrane protein YkoI